MVVDVEKVRKEYHRVEDRLYRLRCNYGYTSTRNQAFRRLEERARRLNKIVRQMETMWGIR
ncbi:MAG TPA: hypothetical protein VK101_01125 [Limnochordia bacterium]|nr:hypothetical protein [Limnochordia bacterium]